MASAVTCLNSTHTEGISQPSPLLQWTGPVSGGVLVVAAGQQAVVLTYSTPLIQQQALQLCSYVPQRSSGGACVVAQADDMSGAVQHALGHEVLRQASKRQGRLAQNEARPAYASLQDLLPPVASWLNPAG